MTQTQLNMLTKWTFWATFLIASYIMLCYYLTSESKYFSAGLWFILIAFIVNIVAIIVISYHTSKNENLGIPKFSGILFLNIPVAFFYVWLAMWLNSYYRITVVNDTSKSIQHVHIMGCEKGETNVLDPGESETFWIKISSDCRGIISYKDDHNNYHSDIIVGYLTNGMGQVDEYHISGKNNPRY